MMKMGAIEQEKVHHPAATCRGKKAKDVINVNKRRFNDTQIESLEKMFEAKARPELVAKQELAENLGLQPRQVAIWFQNKRARSKSKQMEHDYMQLKMSYDQLESKFHSLKKEHHALLIQLRSLRDQTEENCGNQTDNDDEGTNALAKEEKPNLTLQQSCTPTEFLLPMCSGGDVDQPIHVKDTQLTQGGSFSSIEEKGGFEIDEFFYDSCCHYNTSRWWEL